MLLLRNYQVEFAAHVDRRAYAGVRSALLPGRPGSGKSVIGSKIVARAAAAAQHGLVPAHPTLTRPPPVGDLSKPHGAAAMIGAFALVAPPLATEAARNDALFREAVAGDAPGRRDPEWGERPAERDGSDWDSVLDVHLSSLWHLGLLEARGVQTFVATSAAATPIGQTDTTTAVSAALPRSMHNWLQRVCEVCPDRSATATSIVASILAAVMRDDQQEHGEAA
jgi:hypothetical protein